MEYIQQYSPDTVLFDRDTPIFSTGKPAIFYIKNGVVDEKETEMTSVISNFNCPIPVEEQRDISPCPKSFASFILFFYSGGRIELAKERNYKQRHWFHSMPIRKTKACLHIIPSPYSDAFSSSCQFES